MYTYVYVYICVCVHERQSDCSHAEVRSQAACSLLDTLLVPEPEEGRKWGRWAARKEH